MVEQFFLSPKVKQSVIISNMLYIQVASRVTKGLKTKDLSKLGNDSNMSKLQKLLPNAQSPS